MSSGFLTVPWPFCVPPAAKECVACLRPATLLCGPDGDPLCRTCLENVLRHYFAERRQALSRLRHGFEEAKNVRCMQR